MFTTIIIIIIITIIAILTEIGSYHFATTEEERSCIIAISLSMDLGLIPGLVNFLHAALIGLS